MEILRELIRKFQLSQPNTLERIQTRQDIKAVLYREYVDSDNYIRKSAFSDAFRSWRDLGDMTDMSREDVAFAVQELVNLTTAFSRK